jgi:hypothetical protein
MCALSGATGPIPAKQEDDMRKSLPPVAISVAIGTFLALGGCQQNEESAVENRYDNMAAAAENTAESMMERAENVAENVTAKAENAADALQNKAETLRDAGEKKADAITNTTR